MPRVEAGAPDFPEWFAANTERLLVQCRTVPPAGVDQAWHLDLAEVGHLTIRAEPIDVAVTLRGTAEALLLWLWGRIDIVGGEIEVDGDRSVVERWTELLPTS
jgi:hypothetical protein